MPPLPISDSQISMSWKTLAGRLDEIAQAFQSPDGGPCRAAYLLGQFKAEVDNQGMAAWVQFQLKTVPDGGKIVPLGTDDPREKATPYKPML
jgi:hypothetical protein